MPLTILFYLAGGALSFIATLLAFASYIRSKERASGFLALTLFFISLHAFAFAMPFLLIPENETLLGLGYMSGVAFIFLVFISALEVLRFVTKLSQKAVALATLLTTALAVMTLSFMIADFHTPIITDTGIILWNINLASRILIGLSSVTYGLFWGTVFFEAVPSISGDAAKVKFKLIGAAGVVLGIVGLIVHTSTETTQTFIGHILFIIAGIMAIIAYMYKG